MGKYLDQINSPKDIKSLTLAQLDKLASEIREEIISTVASNGGHLAPNLGVVELTLALHYIFRTPHDKIIWDVGHQCYGHKLITGRREQFKTLRRHGGISGFPRPDESEHDAFATGHSSTSISAALGMALARDYNGEKSSVVAVIGDGAMTGGMAFEALNHAGHLKTDLIVVLNDNEMSISHNVGAMSRYLSRIRTDPKYSRSKDEIEQLLRKIPSIGSTVLKVAERLKDGLKYLMVPGMIFEELGFTYLGPVDGHNIGSMLVTLEQAKKLGGPVLVHVLTEKGRGYGPAVEKADKFHGIGPFDIDSGDCLKKSDVSTYTEVFGNTLTRLAGNNPKIIAITAAMCSGTGLSDFAQKYPKRFFDVGIAEQHAVTLAAGMAKSGLKPVVAVYSTFLQRAYDQIIHDVCLQNLPVVFAVDRGGIVGDDGPTHHGVFDYSFLRSIPNITIMAPADENELQHMLFTALNLDAPCALRYPRGTGVGVALDAAPEPIAIGRAEVITEGKDITLLAVGNMVQVARKAGAMLKDQGILATVINARFVKPLDADCITRHAARTGRLITIEENVLAGGFGAAVLELLYFSGYTGIQVKSIGIPDDFVEHGTQSELRRKYGLAPKNVVDTALQMINRRKIKGIK
ncbi:1-deoxy-D-xylulose-5-phosphate synthase [Desulfotruncus alcoholivorax]|uniref:1-deoxy-D-xylulose-5-phosphate synthase n=1 Tax=Desulfotruncus alcoholivorax TaxID=265477 RepID=UPI0004038D56|nr:1-deoxy-D-xylulose-5-phosphate synthase [Desulfotruncus alcoholivorax]